MTDAGIDLGTATVLVYVKNRGIVLREPSVVVMERNTQKILAIGEEARRMLGRTPGNIVALRPLRDGVIADYTVTEAMLRYFLGRVFGRNPLVRPRLMICVPSGITSVEKRAVIQAAEQAGAKSTRLIEEPLAAALGAGLDITSPGANMVVDIGGGTTDIAVLSLGGIVLSHSLRVAGDKLDEAIIRYVRREHNLLIGERTAEEIKINVGTAIPGSRDGTMEVRGRDLVAGLPKNIYLDSRQVGQALMEPLTAITDAVCSVLERTPPELASDLAQRGLVLTGGGALLHGIDTLLRERTGIPVHVADDPLSCVALGAGRALDYPSIYEDHIDLKHSRV